MFVCFLFNEGFLCFSFCNSSKIFCYHLLIVGCCEYRGHKNFDFKLWSGWNILSNRSSVTFVKSLFRFQRFHLKAILTTSVSRDAVIGWPLTSMQMASQGSLWSETAAVMHTTSIFNFFDTVCIMFGFPASILPFSLRLCVNNEKSLCKVCKSTSVYAVLLNKRVVFHVLNISAEWFVFLLHSCCFSVWNGKNVVLY